ncbi:hypothetical protein EXIGLDRAFT_732060 [Exidia glandulosa HHB12029]|uniref:Uncharacterized protein n=1 Tax=Exidia glandulosa HHB12029 TaxID=1314781 RepID=A0A165KWF7_EXIGL|nr:hypothetical protein EXIGLDRAFT_732060 [Exidia glandulosa HHB12029]
MKHAFLALAQRPRRALVTSVRRLVQVRQLDPFAPSTSTIALSSPALSLRPVTLPTLPELYDPTFFDALLPGTPKPIELPKERDAPPANAFMDALNDTANLVRTTNMAFAHASSGSACLDAFSGLNSYTAVTQYDAILSKSWAEDPLKTLRIIWHLRSIHEGQSANEAFYRAFAWLYIHHPRTAILNLSQLVAPVIDAPTPKQKDKDNGEEKEMYPRTRTHGYYKDLLQILVLATNGELTPTAPHACLHVITTPKRTVRLHRGPRRSPHPPETRDARLQAALERNRAVSQAAQRHRAQTAIERSAHVQFLLASDPVYKALFVTVARIFADGISRDLQSLRVIADPATSDEERIRLSFSLTPAAKWAPSIGGMHDKHTNITTAIAELLYARGDLVSPNPALSSPLTQADAHRVRGMYTRWAVSPLRRFTAVTESYMSTQRWGEIPYSRVPSKCMSVNAKHFHKHDQARFSRYLAEVARGGKSISGATLLPHELLVAVTQPMEDFERQVVEAQWNTIVQNIRDAGALENSLAVCDVSGSMGIMMFPEWDSHLMSRSLQYLKFPKGAGRGRGTQRLEPIVPAVALTILLAQAAREPWRNSFITFSADPEIVRLDPSGGLAAAARRIAESAPMGYNTNFNAVFTRLILPMALKHNLKPDEMIKRLFVFSDMEFDQSQRDPYNYSQISPAAWDTEHEIIKAQFEKAGYTMPEIVYWNLQGSHVPRPVTKDVAGTALVTGFSPNMMKLFMAGENPAAAQPEPELPEDAPGAEAEVAAVPSKPVREQMDPAGVMDKALSRPSFSGLRVVD